MNKRILISVLLCVAVLTAGLAGCMKKDDEAAVESPFSILQKKVASLEGWKGSVDKQLTALAAKPTRAEMDAAIKAGVAIPDLAALTARVTALETENATLKAENVALEARVDTLEGSGVVTPTPTGEVSVRIVEETPLPIYSSDPASQYQFTVEIINNTDGTRYVSYNISLVCRAYGGGAAANVTATDIEKKTMLRAFYHSLVFEPIFSPSQGACQQILFYPSSGGLGNKVSVGSGKTETINHLLTIKTVGLAQWEGNLTGVVASTTW